MGPQQDFGEQSPGDGNVPLVTLWDARPLGGGAWGTVFGFDDGLGGGGFVLMRLWLRRTPGMTNAAPPRYRPAHAPLPTLYADGGVRRCYRPGPEDLALVREMFPSAPPMSPPWPHIEAELALAGFTSDALARMTPPTLLRLLQRVRAGGAPAAPASAAPAPKPRRGRRPDTDSAADGRIAAAWRSGCYHTYSELEKELGLPQGAVRLALDRDRKRRPRHLR